MNNNARCTSCPLLTSRQEFWCEDCIAQRDFDRAIERINKMKEQAKHLMNQRDPNWEDFSHPYDSCQG
jgi:hypothetical protein